MRGKVLSLGVILLIAGLASAAQVDEAAIENLFKSLSAPTSTEPPRYIQTQEGFLRFVGAPPGGVFVPDSAGAKSGADSTAKSFLAAHGSAFGVVSSRADYTVAKVNQTPGRTYVKLNQTYNDLPVYGAQCVVQMNELGIACVHTDIMRDPEVFDSNLVSLSPTLTTTIAKEAAIAAVADVYKVSESTLQAAGETKRYVFDPLVVGSTGLPTVAWMTIVIGLDEQIAEVVLIDAHKGNLLLNYPLTHPARMRKVWDANYQMPFTLSTLVRKEGETPCGILDADNAYDFLGDAYEFYKTRHSRDSFDDMGGTLAVTVRGPFDNAYWYGPLPPGYSYGPGYEENHIYVGIDWSTDDAVAHELTHGVTDYTSNLIYEYQSGAMNEAFSDIWGEFVDLTNSRGSDTDEDRWYLFEDMQGGPLRYMKDPTVFGDPDRVNSPYYYRGSGDNGGVHWNSGVINKLAYLITDGDTFNGYTTQGIGIEDAAKLFYEMQSNLLTESSDFLDFYYLLGQATLNLGYDFDQRLNIQKAAKAVEIAPVYDASDIKMFRALPTTDTHGRPVIALAWSNPDNYYFRQAVLVRSLDNFVNEASQGTVIYRGRNEKFLDTAVVSGRTYYYTLFADMSLGFPTSRQARATAGAPVPDFLTETFYDQPLPMTVDNPIDLSFCQITFYPTGAPSAPAGVAGKYGDYNQYTATLRRKVYQLPVPREDENGGSFNLTLENEGDTLFHLTEPFPFFGVPQRSIVIGANGYICFDSEMLWLYNMPSASSHFALPRISPLFSDLDPVSGGTMWARFLKDRAVVTWENVPEWLENTYLPVTSLNTVQAELFYNGQIRFTYGGVNAMYAIVGLSDGSGAPIDPADLFPNIESVDMNFNYSELPLHASLPYLEPVAPLRVDAGSVAEFTVTASWPEGANIPALTAEWSGPVQPIPFVDFGNGTGKFRWETHLQESGDYLVRVTATCGSHTCYQDVYVHIGYIEPLPEALNIKLLSGNPVEDATQDRIVSHGSDIQLAYDYYHPYAAGDISYKEGATEISWYRNNEFMVCFQNYRQIPAQAIPPNTTWYCTVTPYTISGAYGALRGMTFRSPILTVLALPEVLNVVPATDMPASCDPDDLPLEGIPVASGPCTGGTALVILGHRLAETMSVKIGGIEAENIQIVSDWRINVTAPAHISSKINDLVVPEQVTVTTRTGTGCLADCFIYDDAGGALLNADINGDGKVNAIDVQLVINAVLDRSKSLLPVDVNRDGNVNAADIQSVINEALIK